MTVHAHVLFPSAPKASPIPDLLLWHQYRSAFFLDQEHYEFRGFGLASVSPDDVNVIRAFVECLTGCQSHFLAAPHLHHDAALKDIDKRMRVVAMYWV